MEHKTNQSISLNILLLSLPCNQFPRVQPSAQWGSEGDGEKKGCRRTSMEGGSFRLPRIQAGGVRQEENRKSEQKTPT